jgi:hypothetical protein
VSQIDCGWEEGFQHMSMVQTIQQAVTETYYCSNWGGLKIFVMTKSW